ncbi:unnamed protein product [Caenorhabditis bovis]|uniref:Uncharacterized protein n=1 Tax=Caenorhabditis bovis TaxID=2654633 RepID=A0A8S1EXM8_9PELO|nr:unnamed protein product [Caenorhabditis bovis]
MLGGWQQPPSKLQRLVLEFEMSSAARDTQKVSRRRVADQERLNRSWLLEDTDDDDDGGEEKNAFCYSIRSVENRIRTHAPRRSPRASHRNGTPTLNLFLSTVSRAYFPEFGVILNKKEGRCKSDRVLREGGCPNVDEDHGEAEDEAED